MRRNRQARCFGHFHYFQGAGYPTKITYIRLDDIHNTVRNHRAPIGQHTVLFAASNIQIERVCDLFGLLKFPIGAGLFIMANAVVLQQTPHFDGAGWRKTRVGIDQKCDIVAHGLTHGWNNLFGAPGPFVLVVANFATDAKFERIKAMAVAQPAESIGFGLGGDVALHRRGIGANFTR